MIPILFFLLADLAMAQVTFPIRGVLKEKGTRKPLEGVSVFILPHRLKTTSSPNGEFVFEKVPAGEFTFVVNLTNYDRLEVRDEATQESFEKPRTLYAEKSSYQVYETTVFGKKQKRDDTQKALKREQFLTMPGSGGDPIKAVQNLPGVTRPPSFSSQIIIQGSGPQDTRYTIDQHEVPIIFHFGGFSSVVYPEALDRVEMLSTGYGPEFGRANGGLVTVVTKSPEKDRLHGQAFLDLLNSGALIEGPLTEKSRFLLSGRHSYIGYTLRPVLKGNPSFNLTLVPSYSDLTGIFESELSDRIDFKWVNTGSLDRLDFLFTEPLKQDPSIRGRFESRTAFFRTIPQLTLKHSEISTSRASLGAGRDWIKFVNGDNYFFIRNYQLTQRLENERKNTDWWTHYIGIDNRSSRADVDINLPKVTAAGGVRNPFSSGDRQQVTIRSAWANYWGGYIRNSFKILDTGLTLTPNLRMDYFTYTHEFLPAPRGAIRYDWDDSLQFRVATGLYYQPPQEQELSDKFGNPDLKSPRATHYTTGVEKDFRNGSADGVIASLDGFYKNLDRLVISSTQKVTRNNEEVLENYNNDGKGLAYGAQTSIRLEYSPWSTTLNYTASKSKRRRGAADWTPFQYDQTHSIGWIAAFQIGNWKFATRYRYSTGNPYTPIIGSYYDADNDIYTPVRGTFYSERLTPFQQLDFRIDKKFVFEKWILSAYLDIQNITNRRNPEQVIYSYDYRDRTTISGLPILPTLGLKGEF